MDINLGLVAVIITVIIIIGAVITKQCLACMIVGSILASVFAFWQRIFKRVDGCTAEYACGQCVGNACVPAFRRIDKAAYRFQRKLRICQVYIQIVQYET